MRRRGHGHGHGWDEDRHVTNEPRCKKTGLRGFRPGPTQTGLHRSRLEA